MQQQSFYKYLIVLVLVFLFNPLKSKAYSVLTHEAVIDASWEKYLKPLLKEKYPLATDSDLIVAHSYAYGGCLIPDMGYFPFGSEYFTDLAHYVRTGDFVEALLSESQNLNEYAFSLGALCHYMADKYGHSIATNYAVPLIYPKIEKKYGHVVTYGEDRISHSRTEISFDVLQIARGNYATAVYHNFIGFNVAKPVLERAFIKTYGEDINSVFGDLDLAISTFRWSVKSLLPTLTRAAWVIKKSDIKKQNPTATSRSFHYKMKRKDYYLEYGKNRQKPGFKANMLALFLRIVPKIGPFKALKFKDPGPEAEKLFMRSFDTVLLHYSAELLKLHYEHIKLPNVDYDTGYPTTIGEYTLADKTYNQLVINLQTNKFSDLTYPLKENILAFYNPKDTVKVAQEDPDQWKKAYVGLQDIKNAKTVKIDSLKTIKGINYKMIAQ
ncbi:zinc dependent phospholipase C family protein [Mucilaginibacter sp.]